VPDFTRYLPPGVYVDSNAIPTVAPPGVDPTVVCLIGEGIGYHTYTETVSFATASSVVLTKKGVNVSSIVVAGVITDPAAPGQTLPYTFAAGTSGSPADYSTTVDASGGVDESLTTLLRTVTGKIETDNPQVTVTYRYTDADYHGLHAFDDYDTFTDVYGQALDPSTGDIASPLSLAAQIAMQNGANYLYAIALSGVGTVQQQFQDAYALLAGNYEANVVVPLLNGVITGTAVAGLAQSFKGMIENDAREGILRMGIIGTDKDYDPTISEVATLAASISSSRIVLAWPNRLRGYNGVLNQDVELDGFYLAAAYAGMLAAREPQMPLTKKYPISFSGMPTTVAQTLTKSAKNILSAAGTCVTELDRSARLVVRHGLTTNYSGGVIAREISLIRAQDALYNLVQSTLENSGLIGIPIQAETGLRVKSVVSGALEFAQQRGIIVSYDALKVRQQSPPSGDPTVIEVKFAYKPSYPLNYILVSFTIDTTTGETNLTTTTTAISDAASTASAQA
jgi:hypothetical protein